MGNQYGAIKTAAKRLGISVADYATHILLGEKWCYVCSRWLDRSGFTIDRSRGDGRSATCAHCRGIGTTLSPSLRVRRQQRAAGHAWCSDCETWLLLYEVRNGKCRAHQRIAARERYRTNAAHRFLVKQRTAQRRRNVDAVPPEAEELLLDSFAGECAYCPRPADTWDHIVAVSRGGETVPWNIVPACRSCNSRKHDKDIDEWLQNVSPEKAADVIELQAMEELPLRYHAMRLVSKD